MLQKFDEKIKEHLLDPAVEDEVPLYSTETFLPELGITYDGDGIGAGAGDFDNAKHAYESWAFGKMQSDNEKMKSAALYLMSRFGDPKACSRDGHEIFVYLKSALGYDLLTSEFALSEYDAPLVQEFLVPYLRQQAETKTRPRSQVLPKRFSKRTIS